MLRIVLGSLRIVTIGVIAALIVFGTVQFFQYYQDRTASADVGKTVKIKISQKDTTSSVAKILKDKGLIRYEFVFEGEVKAKSGEVIPGTYNLRIGMSAVEIADYVTGKSTPTPDKAKAGNNQNDAATITVTVVEGWRTEQIADELVKQGWKGSTADFMKAVKNFDASHYEFLADKKSDGNPDWLEGYLFPDTYDLSADAPAEDLVQKMLDNFNDKFNEQLRQRASEMNLSVNDVLIFASIIEREAKLGSERPTIADVYLNRYEQGMKFDADPTVQYAMGKEGSWWPVPTGDDLQNVNSPYNTYLNGGLPPGPICNPGIGSIQAVLQPAGTNYLYFVLKNPETGEHVFAETYNEQLANQELYQNGGGSGDSNGSGDTTDQQTPTDGGSTDQEVPIEQTGG
ncbi:MAG: endolytic transglycosylase MltG [Thermomicrobiales bacterium]